MVYPSFLMVYPSFLDTPAQFTSEETEVLRWRGDQGLWAHGKRLGDGVLFTSLKFLEKNRHCFPLHTLPHPSPPLTRVMSSRGTFTPAFEVACFSEHILNFALCLVWVWLLCLSLCRGGWQLLVRLLPQLSITEYRGNKPTNPKSQTKKTFEGRMHIPHGQSSLLPTRPHLSHKVQTGGAEKICRQVVQFSYGR